MRISDWSSDVCSSDLDRGEAEAAVFRHARQQVGIAAALVPEYEIVSHDDVTGAESFDQREAHEILRRELREVTIEALHDHHLDTERIEEMRLGPKRRQAEGRGVGPEEAPDRKSVV